MFLPHIYIFNNIFFLFKIDSRSNALESLINSKTSQILEAIRVSPYKDYVDFYNQDNIHAQTNEVSTNFLKQK